VITVNYKKEKEQPRLLNIDNPKLLVNAINKVKIVGPLKFKDSVLGTVESAGVRNAEDVLVLIVEDRLDWSATTIYRHILKPALNKIEKCNNVTEYVRRKTDEFNRLTRSMTGKQFAKYILDLLYANGLKNPNGISGQVDTREHEKVPEFNVLTDAQLNEIDLTRAVTVN
jgi:hypothetical protein